jgi:dimethylargininase
VTLAAPDLLVYQPGTVDIDHFRDVESLAVEEPAGANVLLIGEVVLVSASAPQTAERLAQRGCTVQVLCVDEFHKADGALTCLSIRVPQPGSWVT